MFWILFERLLHSLLSLIHPFLLCFTFELFMVDVNYYCNCIYLQAFNKIFSFQQENKSSSYTYTHCCIIKLKEFGFIDLFIGPETSPIA